MSLNNCLVIKFLASENSYDGEVAVYTSVEFGLAEVVEEHVEDWLEYFRTCHRRPQQIVTQWGQCLDTD